MTAAAPRTTLERMTDLIGGQVTLKRKLTSSLDCIPLVRAGLPYKCLEALTGALGMPVESASDAPLLIPERTRARRKKAKRLDPQESERVIRLARVMARAAEVLGTNQKGLAWLREPNRALRREVPLDLLDTDIGAQAVEDVLGRIEHGVFS